MQSPQKSKQWRSNPLYLDLYKKFDKTLTNSLEHFKKVTNFALFKLDTRLDSLEARLYDAIQRKDQETRADLHLAETLVNRELRAKISMSQWTNSFLVLQEQTQLNAISFSIARFALNLCLCYQDIPVARIHQLHIPQHLLDYIASHHSFQRETSPDYLVVGPCLLALYHLSLHHETKALITTEYHDAMNVLLKLLLTTKSVKLLALCCEVLASIALHDQNKPIIARSGCLHALFDLILGSYVDVDEATQFSALSAIGKEPPLKA